MYLVTPPLLQRALRAGSRRVLPQHGDGLVQRDLGDLFPGILDTTVRLSAREWRREAGMLPLPELVMLAAICAHLRPRVVLEIGTYLGSSTLALASNSPAEAEIYTLDLPPSMQETRYPLEIGSIRGTPFRLGERYQGSAVEGKIRQLTGDSASFDFSPWYGRAEVIFVDGNHAYENVRADSRNAFRCLRPGGVIVWDDYHPQYGPGVMRALHEFTDRTILRIADTRFAVYAGLCGQWEGASDFLRPGSLRRLYRNH